MGRNNGWQGRHHSSATKAKISAANRARAGKKIVGVRSRQQVRAAQASRAKPITSHPNSLRQIQSPKRNKTSTRVMKNIRSSQKVRFARVTANHPNLRQGTRPTPTHRQSAKAHQIKSTTKQAPKASKLPS